MTLVKNREPDDYVVHTMQKGLQSGRTNIMRVCAESIARLLLSREKQIKWEQEGRLEKKLMITKDSDK